jgi:hypothetical protein
VRQMVRVNWVKPRDGGWFSLRRLKLETVVRLGGCYVIWEAGQPSTAVRVGQGIIPNRLGEHRRDRLIMEYGPSDSLYVTWTILPENLWDGVEVFLAQYYEPLVGVRYPEASPIRVNLPGEFE